MYFSKHCWLFCPTVSMECEGHHFFLFYCLLIYWKGRVATWGQETRRNFSSVGSLPTWPQQEAAAPSGSPYGLRHPRTWALSRCASRCIIRELNWKWSNWDSDTLPYGMQTSCVAPQPTALQCKPRRAPFQSLNGTCNPTSCMNPVELEHQASPSIANGSLSKQ